MDTTLIIALALLVVGFLALGIHPTTRPWALKLWWAFLAAGVGIVGILIGRSDADDDDSDIVELRRRAQEERAKREAEQARARLESQSLLDAYDAEAEEIRKLPDARERRERWAKMGKGA